MKRLFSLISFVVVLGSACGPSISLKERPLFTNGVNTITFSIYDAVTGAAITNASLKIAVGSYSLEATKQSDNAYVVSQVPGGTHLANVEAPGYVGFVGQPVADCTGTLGSTAQCFKAYQLALYPLAGVDSDVSVKAFESSNGAPVTSGTVVATLTAASNWIGTTFPNPLSGSLTIRPSTIIANLGASGSATFAKGALVLGGTYSVDVFAAKGATGQYLVPEENRTFTAGKSFPQLTLFMGPPAQAPVALTANNESPGVRATLVVTFPFPVELCSEDRQMGWVIQAGGSDANGNGIRPIPNALTPVSAALSGDGGQLTLTANFANAPSGASTFEPDDGLLEVAFTGVRLQVKGTTTCTSLNSIRLREGTNVSTVLRMAASR